MAVWVGGLQCINLPGAAGARPDRPSGRSMDTRAGYYTPIIFDRTHVYVRPRRWRPGALPSKPAGRSSADPGRPWRAGELLMPRR